MFKMGGEDRYFTITYGCQMNVSDTELIEAVLKEELGMREASNIEDASVIVVNTCCVRKGVEDKIYGKIGDLKRLKKKNPALKILVCGCLAQKERAHLYKKFPFLDAIVGTLQIGDIKKVFTSSTNNSPLLLTSFRHKECKINPRRKNPYSAYITITYGCNNFCSFCIVPYVRGREKSRPLQDIIKEVKELANKGYKEITLLGQNVNSYGHNLTPPSSFVELLTELNEIEGIERIRFTTSHPRDFSSEDISAIANLKKVCEHFHLPLQSGSNKILTLMNRGYTVEHYLKLVEEIRRKYPRGAITTDLIVGFPQETDEDFYYTLEIVRRVQFDQAFMFAYSPLPGTKAANFSGQIPQKIKKERLWQLIKEQNEITEKKNKALIGEEREVLFTGFTKKNSLLLSGRTGCNRLVAGVGADEYIWKIVKVKIKEGYLWGVKGEVIEESKDEVRR